MNDPMLTCRDASSPWAGDMTFTPDESWTTTRTHGHWYNACADFALEKLGNGGGHSCLVIGSPIFEALELSAARWAVTYLDVREPPKDSGLAWLKADATNIPLPDASVDAVSSTCVLCHAGLGRYGDARDLDGDAHMISEIARVLKPGGKAAIGFGPTADCEGVHFAGTLHRVYSPQAVHNLCAMASLEVLKLKIFSRVRNDWLLAGEPLTKELDRPDYICAFLRKNTT